MMTNVLQKLKDICGYGGIGRRKGLKIPRFNDREGSTPSSRTIVTSLTIKDLKEQIRSMAPIAIYINCDLVWDDEAYEDAEKSLEQYHEVLNQSDLVAGLYFKIVEFHHTEVYIYTV